MNAENPDEQTRLDEFLDREPVDKRKRLKFWIAIGVATMLALVILVRLVFFGSSGPKYATAEIVHGDMTVHVTATGNLQPTNEITVGSQVSGLIDKVYADVNDHVTKDEPLAQINTDTLKAAVQRSQAALAQAKASVDLAQAQVSQSKGALTRQKEVYRLSDGKIPSKTDMDTARATYQGNVATLASNRASVMSAQAQLTTDQTNLGFATIRSPVDGVVLSRQIEPGQTVAAAFSTPTLFIIAQDLTQMKLEVKVDEADVGQVKEGQPATFTVDAYPGKTFDARITRVDVGSNTTGSDSNSSTSSASTSSSSNVVSYGAVLTVRNKDLALRPGMTATANIITSEQKNVLIVPNAALRFQPSQKTAQHGFMFGPPSGPQRQEVGIGRGSVQTIYVLHNDGALKTASVQVGDTDGASTIVNGTDLKPGMKVVTGELAQSR